MNRAGEWLFVVLVTALAVATTQWLGIDGWNLMRGLAAACGLLAFYAIVRYPWDLYLEARGLAIDQRESKRRDIAIHEDDEAYAEVASRRLLFACLGIHVAAAAIAFAVGRFAGDELGNWFAAFYLLGTALRPAATLYRHLKVRLQELRKRTRFPREDVVALQQRVEQLELDAKHDREEREQLQQAHEARGVELEATQRLLAETKGDFEAKVDRVCREMTRSLEQLTDDRELLAGIRAFVHLVKST
ncbi:MAG: hypothetical protein AAGE52_37610 [Myxococcota bacterium]